MNPTIFALMSALLLTACGKAPVKMQEPENSSPAPAQAERGARLPQAFHGTFDRDLAACESPSEYRLQITSDTLRFHESVATISDILAFSPFVVQVSASFEGEGETWRETRKLRLEPDGQRLSIEAGGGERVDRVRCDTKPASDPVSPDWDTASSGEGNALLYRQDGQSLLTLFCPARSSELVVNVTGFRPVASEERMSLGSGGTVVALVANPEGDMDRGGVTARGRLPAELPDILKGSLGIGVNYGAQNMGPYGPPPPNMVADFLTGCSD